VKHFACALTCALHAATALFTIDSHTPSVTLPKSNDDWSRIVVNTSNGTSLGWRHSANWARA
jgi:hypothetical protein